MSGDNEAHVEILTEREIEHDEIWWRIYERSFPKDEREPRETIVRSASDGLGIALRMRSSSVPETLGLATLQYLPDLKALFLVYLAVAEGKRGAGLGSRLFAETLRLGSEHVGQGALDLVWEVDDPGTAGNEVERHKRERRIGFFRRQGGELLPCAYRQPAVDRVAPVPMLLMWKPRAGARPPGAEATERVIKAIYFQKYGHVNRIPTQELEELLAGLRRERSQA